jgi:acetolactate synthase-1/2/3 large subunit
VLFGLIYAGVACIKAAGGIAAVECIGCVTAQWNVTRRMYMRKKSSMLVGIQSFRTAIMFMLLQADLMIALGVRFDDRVTGKLEAFATRSRIVHIDIDPAEIHKNKHAHIPICAGAAQRGGPAAG